MILCCVNKNRLFLEFLDRATSVAADGSSNVREVNSYTEIVVIFVHDVKKRYILWNHRMAHGQYRTARSILARPVKE